MPDFNLVDTIYRWRVRAGFVGIILAIILANPNLTSLLGGIGICSVGLLIRTWSCGHLRKEKELVISGPYRYTRNPLYVANLVIGMSAVLASRSWWMFGIFSAYFLLFYPVVIKKEKERMIELFPREYDKYRKKTPLFFPSLKNLRTHGKNKFSWKLYWKNKEWRAFLGADLFWVIMTGKLFFFS